MAGSQLADSPAIARALAAYPGLSDPRVAPLSQGLIHRSFSVRDRDAEYILQQVNPIFSPRIHDNILAVTEHLHAKGLLTLRLVTTAERRAYVDLGEEGIWRLLTRLPGVGFDVCDSTRQARSAGALVARFHSALDDLDHEFHPLGISLHATDVHLRALEEALASHRGHRLYEDVAALGRQILEEASGWEPLEGLPARVAHGDLKFNNVLFGRRGAARDEALSLIDLDTVSRMPLYVELGDAWRSWCNPQGEDATEARFDLELFEASTEGYLDALEIDLDPAERESLVHGVERISLELAARFAADTLRESYFGWDPARFSSAGEHNLLRARGQFSLYRQARKTRGPRTQILSRAARRGLASPEDGAHQ